MMTKSEQTACAAVLALLAIIWTGSPEARAASVTLSPGTLQGYFFLVGCCSNGGYDGVQTSENAPFGPYSLAPTFPAGTATAGGFASAGYSLSSPLTSPVGSPSLSVNATASTGFYNGFEVFPSAQADVIFNYSMEVVGGPNFGSVPINVISNATTTGSPPYAAGSADLTVSANNGGTIALNETAISGTNQSSWHLSESMSVETGTIYNIHMEVFAGSDPSSGLLSASASIDPYFFLDPSLVADGYSLAFSPGVGNGPVTATPVPAALPLFATGLSALGLFGWRRKRKKAAAIGAA